MRNVLIVISTVLVLLSPIVYIRSILGGETKPHRTTRFVIWAITLLSTWSLIDSNFSAAFWLSAASMIQTSVVLALSFKHGYGGWAKLDIICLIIAAVGVIIWQVSGKPLLGLYASIIADVVGNIPALVKTYRLPYSENWQFFALDTLSGTLSFMALTSYSIYTASYPAYIVVINGAMAVLILWGRRQPDRQLTK